MKTIKFLITIVVWFFVSVSVFSQEQDVILEKDRIYKQKMDNKQSEIELVADLREKLKQMRKEGVDHASVEYREIELQIEEKILDYRLSSSQYTRKQIRKQKRRFKMAEINWKDAMCHRMDHEKSLEEQDQSESEKLEKNE